MSNVPQLRFSEFSGEWKNKRIKEFIKLVSGQHLSPNEYICTPKDLPYFTGPSDYTNDISELTKWALTSSKIAYSKDILITVKGNGVGKLFFLKLDKVALGRQLMAMRTTKASSAFLYHILIERKKTFVALASGNMIPGLSRLDILQMKLYFPLLVEQEKIASFLTSVDTKIEQLTSKTKLLQEYKKGVMQKIFSQMIKFKDDDGSEFPAWEEKKLGDVGEFKSGTGFSEKEQGGLKGLPFYKVSDMNLVGNENHMVTANNYVTTEQVNRLKYKPIEPPSILFAKVGAAIFLERKRIANNFLIDNNMMSFTPNCNISFIRQWFDTVRLSKYAQVGALPSYNASDLKTIKINLPSLLEQTKIANFLSSIDSKIEQTQKQLDSTKEFKKALLQQMFV